jgi:hypothetical protein
MHYPTIPCLTNIFIVTCTATVIPVIIMFISIFSDNPDPGTNCMVDQDSSRKQKMVFQLRTIPIHLLLHHLFLQATSLNANIYIASLIFVMDLNDNEYKKKLNISKRQSSLKSKDKQNIDQSKRTTNCKLKIEQHEPTLKHGDEGRVST